MSDPVAVNPKSGLTPAEHECHEHLLECYRTWLLLPQQHPDDHRTVCDAVHAIQSLLTNRIARRCYPFYWVDRSAENPMFNSGESE